MLLPSKERMERDSSQNTALENNTHTLIQHELQQAEIYREALCKENMAECPYMHAPCNGNDELLDPRSFKVSAISAVCKFNIYDHVFLQTHSHTWLKHISLNVTHIPHKPHVHKQIRCWRVCCKFYSQEVGRLSLRWTRLSFWNLAHKDRCRLHIIDPTSNTVLDLQCSFRQ